MQGKHHALTLSVVFVVFIVAWMGCRATSQQLRLSIVEDTYVYPVAELATTETYPDIIQIENNYIKASLLPNRGRLLFDYYFKPTGHSEIYTETRPSPVMTSGGYTIEFGGYYLSVPWNSRVRQPYDLEYKIVKDTPQEIEVHVWGKDPLTRLVSESCVKIKANSSLVEVRTKITNTHKKRNWKVKFSDYLIIAPGGGLSKNSFFLLPTHQIRIGKSEKEWMGKEGSLAGWPQAWAQWGEFEDLGSFSVPIDTLWDSFVGMANRESGDTFLTIWEPDHFFDTLHVWSWGRGYMERKGGTPTAHLEYKKKDLQLAPGSSIEFSMYLYGLRAIRELGNANKNFAGEVHTDKKAYRRNRDKVVRVYSQIGTSGEYENLSVVYFLREESRGTGEDVWSEDILMLAPNNAYESAFTINPDTLTQGTHSLTAYILDSLQKIMFQVDSPVFLIE